MLKTSLPDLEAMKNSYKLRSDNLRTLIFDGTNTAESSQFHVQRPTV